MKRAKAHPFQHVLEWDHAKLMQAVSDPYQPGLGLSLIVSSESMNLLDTSWKARTQ
jgi:hypothetical protein